MKKDETTGDDRLIKHTLRIIYDNPQDGDLFIDVRGQSWKQLVETANDKNKWKLRVTRLNQISQLTTCPESKKIKQTRCVTNLKTRLTPVHKLMAHDP